MKFRTDPKFPSVANKLSIVALPQFKSIIGLPEAIYIAPCLFLVIKQLVD